MSPIYAIIKLNKVTLSKKFSTQLFRLTLISGGVIMADETSIVARQVRLRQWAEQIRDCQNRPEGMDVSTWCALHNITKANYYYRLKRVRKACLDQIPKAAHPAFVELLEPKRKAAIPADISDQDIPALGAPVIRITSADGLSAEILASVSPEMLRCLIEAFSHVQ